MSRHKPHLDPETGSPFYPLAHAQCEEEQPVAWRWRPLGGVWQYADSDALFADAAGTLEPLYRTYPRTPAAVEPAQCEAGSRFSPRQQASKMLFGDIHWVDREDMSDLMDDEFVYDDGSHKRNISPNALITELEAAQQGIDAIIAKLDACLVPDNVLDEVRSALTAPRTPAASEGPFNAEMPSSLNDACRRLDLAQERISQLEAQVEEASGLIHDLLGLELGSSERAMAWLDSRSDTPHVLRPGKVCGYHDGCPPDGPVCHLCEHLQP